MLELNQFQQEWYNNEHIVHMVSVLYYIQDGQKNYSDMSLITSSVVHRNYHYLKNEKTRAQRVTWLS